MDALKADAELADIPVIMISIVDDRLAAAPKKFAVGGHTRSVLVVEELAAGRICRQTPGVASSGELRCGIMASTAYRTCLFLPLALFLSGCMFVNGLDWSEDSFTRKKPNQADMIGVWVPTASTIKDLKEHGGYVVSKHELILRADGTFAMVNMPDWWLDGAGESKKGFESGSGKWEFYQGHIQWTVWGIELNFGKFATGNLINLRRQKPPYLINITIGDPDSAHNMLFEKVPDPKQR